MVGLICGKGCEGSVLALPSLPSTLLVFPTLESPSVVKELFGSLLPYAESPELPKSPTSPLLCLSLSLSLSLDDPNTFHLDRFSFSL